MASAGLGRRRKFDNQYGRKGVIIWGLFVLESN
jgi:hypothetical protein